MGIEQTGRALCHPSRHSQEPGELLPGDRPCRPRRRGGILPGFLQLQGHRKDGEVPGGQTPLGTGDRRRPDFRTWWPTPKHPLSRRKYLLHYFGEEFDEINGEGAGMDDNSRHLKPKIEAGEQLRTLIRVVKDTSQTFRPKEITNILVGRVSSAIKGLKVDKKPFFRHRERPRRPFLDGSVAARTGRGLPAQGDRTIRRVESHPQGRGFSPLKRRIS